MPTRTKDPAQSIHGTLLAIAEYVTRTRQSGAPGCVETDYIKENSPILYNEEYVCGGMYGIPHGIQLVSAKELFTDHPFDTWKSAGGVPASRDYGPMDERKIEEYFGKFSFFLIPKAPPVHAAHPERTTWTHVLNAKGYRAFDQSQADAEKSVGVQDVSEPTRSRPERRNGYDPEQHRDDCDAHLTSDNRDCVCRPRGEVERMIARASINA